MIGWIRCLFWSYAYCGHCRKRYGFPERRWEDLRQRHVVRGHYHFGLRCPHCAHVAYKWKGGAAGPAV